MGGDKSFRFARPVHWFVSIFDGSVIEFEIDGIKSGNRTMGGHRIHANSYFEVKNFEDYKTKLREASVIYSSAERVQAMRDQVAVIEKETGYKVDLDEELLDTVAGLVEFLLLSWGGSLRRSISIFRRKFSSLR